MLTDYLNHLLLKGGRDFGIMLACLAELDYSVEWRVINAAEYGAAQRRRRVFIFIYRNDTNYGKSMVDAEAYNVLRYDGFFARTFPVQNLKDQIITMSINYHDINDVSTKFKFSFKNSGYMTNGTIYTANINPVKEQPTIISQIIQSNVDDKYFITNEKFERYKYLKGSKKIKRTNKTGHDYVYSEGAVSFPDSLDKPARTILTSEGTTTRSSHVIKDPQNEKLRVITPLEAERIQGFKDGWTDIMPERMRYFCMGNALVVPMVTRMGKTLNKIFELES